MGFCSLRGRWTAGTRQSSVHAGNFPHNEREVHPVNYTAEKTLFVVLSKNILQGHSFSTNRFDNQNRT